MSENYRPQGTSENPHTLTQPHTSAGVVKDPVPQVHGLRGVSNVATWRHSRRNGKHLGAALAWHWCGTRVHSVAPSFLLRVPVPTLGQAECGNPETKW